MEILELQFFNNKKVMQVATKTRNRIENINKSESIYVCKYK